MITKDMSIIDIVQKYPETRLVFEDYNLGCIGCLAAAGETISDGLIAHGLDPDTVIADLNKAIQPK
ncbi:MAG: disulfide oxidoreductase [Candidatus Margulisiibacteriota bacterium]|nr:MAG: disulfide oxidoreductase [Candidatus Margulisbacteria bacterium GWD2_39_127]OGI02973.1 MAG: disulfide oxidoreductase [Candidatus Margulisbacteria bacterium GWF2_38_17]OGI09434.1 MAG: disulfide oxidoreductase [Candidatus Margulisbacteria bacterium GWE2_39_32]PZM78766.1 MAG: disulfide oxidoreductase [Candidatus Margulisiibacteriota bacterium]HAR63332.1 disulfide oxidoreductase [Candidatus Margulisiibacteriota bacterium]